MPYQVKVGTVTAIVANEREALAMVHRLTTSSGDEKASIADIFGGEIDIAALRARIGEKPYVGCGD